MAFPVSSAICQESAPRDISTVERAPLGGALALEIPEDVRIDQSQIEVPELAGSRQVIGSQLVEGELPRPVFDYSVITPHFRERLTLFGNGLVSVRIRQNDQTIQKKVLLPEDAVAAYRAELTGERLALVDKQSLSPSRRGGESSIRVWNDDGTWVERRFDPSQLLPRLLERQRTVLEDLVRAIAQDREVTNSVAGYTPRVGDQLVSHDRRIYEVIRIIEDGRIVELRCLSQPTKIYLAANDLHNHFVGSRPRAD
jgi:hypothetical protein